VASGLDVKTVFLSYSFLPEQTPRAVQVGRLVMHLALRPLAVVCAQSEKGRAAAPASVPSDVSVDRIPIPFASRIALMLQRLPFRDRVLVPDAYRAWGAAAARHLLSGQKLSGTDVLVTFGQPMSDHLAGLAVKRRTGVNWIAHFSDPWVDNPFRNDGWISRAWNLRLERAVIEEADRVIFTSDETADLVMIKYPAAWRAKVRVLGHAFEPALYPPRTGLSPGSPLIFRHIGHFYGARSPECLYAAVDRLLTRRPDLMDTFRIEFIGSLGRLIVRPAEGTLAARHLVFNRPVGYEESLRLMVEADALLVVDAPAKRSVFLPSKLVEYLGAGPPILAITPPGTSANLMTRLGGTAISPEDTEGIGRALEKLIDGLRSGTASRPWAPADATAEFRVDRVAAVMTDIIEEVRGARTRI
jgi:glycosyltransferase involved in cell wall biosynthesis